MIIYVWKSFKKCSVTLTVITASMTWRFLAIHAVPSHMRKGNNKNTMDDYEKKCKVMELSVNKKFLASQGICLPLSIILSEGKLQNWYQLHYMKPVARLDGLSSLSCYITDGLIYGAGSKIYNKIIRTSSINIDICKEIQNIVGLIKRKIEKKYYIKNLREGWKDEKISKKSC